MRPESEPRENAAVGPSPPLPHLKVSGARKRFGGVEALRGVDFEARRGEVMGLVGDNGAGKSTLMKILAGAERGDRGKFFLDGREVFIASPHDAADLGIRIVYQDLALCENLDVSANLFLGREPTRGGWAAVLPRLIRPMDSLRMERRAQEAVERLRVRTLHSVRAKVGGLSGGQRQAIAIARAVGADSSVVLLDEPTAALGVEQTRQVLDVVRRLRETGHAVVYISHNLRDVFEVCDRVTVLRHGANVAIYDAAKTGPDEIVSAMTRGRDDSMAGRIGAGRIGAGRGFQPRPESSTPVQDSAKESSGGGSFRSGIQSPTGAGGPAGEGGPNHSGPDRSGPDRSRHGA